MEINIDKIAHGMPTREDMQLLKMDSYLDGLINEIIHTFPPPQNSSTATKQELNILVDYSMADAADETKLYFDRELLSYIQDVYISLGHPEQDIMNTTQSIVDDVLPVVNKLKYKFQRPRPSVLAYYLKLQLFPYFSYFINSPSYPSTHVTLAAVLAEVLGNKYPATYQPMQKMVKDIAESRLYLGVHYPSDNNTAMLLAGKIVTNETFMKKYGL